MAAAYAFGRGRKGRPERYGQGWGLVSGIVGSAEKNFFDFFVDKEGAFWQCAFLPRGCSSVGRALEWHSRGQEFNSPQLHQKRKSGFAETQTLFSFLAQKCRQQKSRSSDEPRLFRIRLKEPSVSVCALAHGGFFVWYPLHSHRQPGKGGRVCVRAHLIHAALLSYQERFLLVKKTGLC